MRKCKMFGVCLGLLACSAASAQYLANFEDPPFLGSAAGTIMTGQDMFYIPPGTTSVDFMVYTYTDNALGIVAHPIDGGEQFVGGVGPGANTQIYARAQRDITWGEGLWTAVYDVACLYDPDQASGNNLGSFSVRGCVPAPGTAKYIHLFSWVDIANPALGWQAFYMAFNAAGVQDPQPGQSPGPEWANLAFNQWYRFLTMIDLDANQIINVCMIDLATGASGNFSPVGWYLEGGVAPTAPATGFRLFAGGGVPTANTVAWDNLVIGLTGDMDCDGDVDAFDIDPFVLALTDPAGYAAAYPNCSVYLADIDGNCVIDAFDIDPFVILLTGG